MRRQLNILALACLSLSGCSQPADRPNIVVIVLDTVRRDATGLEANEHWGENTPHLDRLAGESTRFTRAFSAAPWTVPSHASMFTGQLPSEHGCTFTNTKLSGEVETMAELLAAEGYATAAFFSNPWLTDRATGLLRGFETRREAVIGGLGKLTSARGDQGGHETVANVAEWLDQRPDGKPFLLFVNFLEAHLPYDPPDHYRASHLGDLAPDEVVSIQRGHEINAGAGDLDTAELESIRRLYCGDVNHADRMLSRLLRELKLRDVFADSVVVVTSDHGENLGEYGLIDHQFSVEESLLAVPLVVRAPAYMAAGERSDLVMTTDIFATVLEVAGVSHGARLHSVSLTAAPDEPELRSVIGEYAGPSAALGEVLTALNPEREIEVLLAPRRTLRMGELRLTAVGGAPPMLHDMAEDPDQRRDIAADHGDLAHRLEVLLQASSAETGGRPVEDSSVEPSSLDEETRRQLEALGYVR